MEFENNLITDKHILIYGTKDESWSTTIQNEFDYVINNFCGKVCSIENYKNNKNDNMVYFCGNYLELNLDLENIIIISNLTFNYTDTNKKSIDSSCVPINFHNIGLMIRNFFEEKDYFEKITNEHKFQTLTESNKPSNAFRTGIYLTPVTKTIDGLEFNLLRCSSNLGGPTDNFRNTDHEIVNKLNEISKQYFDKPVNLNHILAQVYHNSTQNGTDKKAKIKVHSDKTKDMQKEGIMAFCSFYQNIDNLKYQESILTRLRFKSKSSNEKYDVILYPNSVFFMSLSTNRLYTHEIIPSTLPIDKIPTRMGYVVRCSNIKAIHKNGKTYLVNDNNLIELVEPTDEGITKLKELYYQENISDDIISYDEINFSLNTGDYLEPII